MAFCDVIRFGNPPNFGFGAGGKENVIWHSWYNTTDNVAELSTVDFSVIQSRTISASPEGIGGNTTVVWHADHWYGTSEPTRLLKLNPADLSIIATGRSPSVFAYCIGGDTNTIWHDNYGSALVYELSEGDFSVIRSATSPGAYPHGIGGDIGVIWHCDIGLDFIYELSVVDFSVIRSAASPDATPTDIGGDVNTIWHQGDAYFYELDTGKYPSYIWCSDEVGEETELHYIDANGDERAIEGTTTGQTGIAGHLWVEGTYLHYIDSAGAERRQEGTAEGATGKIAGHLWIEATKLRYIDASGNERYIEGTVV